MDLQPASDKPAVPENVFGEVYRVASPENNDELQPARAKPCAPEDVFDMCPSLQTLLGRLVAVAGPAYLMTVVGMSLGLFSIGLVGQLNDTNELAAAGLGGVVVGMTGYSWLHGLSGGIMTLSSQSWGAGSFHAVGLNAQRGFLILLIFCDLPLILIWLNAGSFLKAVGQSPKIAELVGLYCFIRAPGIFFETINAVMSKTLLSMSKVEIIAAVGIFTVILNVSLNYILIKRFGFIGAPLAWLLSDMCQATGVCILAYQDADVRKCWPGITRDAFKEWPAFLRIGFPNLLLFGIEFWSWDLQTFLSGFISPLAQATQSVGPQITGVLYATGAAFNAGATTVVGNLIGEGKGAGAKRAALISVQIVLIMSLVQTALMFAFKDAIPALFTPDPATRTSMAAIMPLTVAFSFFDTNQCVLGGIIVAAGQQRLAAPLIFVCYWIIGVPLGAVLAFGFLGCRKRGLEGLWIGMLAAVICHLLCFTFVVLRIDWRMVCIDVRARTLREKGVTEGDARAIITGLDAASAHEVELDSKGLIKGADS